MRRCVVEHCQPDKHETGTSRGAATQSSEQSGAAYVLECNSDQDGVDWAAKIRLVGDGGLTAVESADQRRCQFAARPRHRLFVRLAHPVCFGVSSLSMMTYTVITPRVMEEEEVEG